MGSADFRLVRPVTVSGDVPFSRASPGSYFDRTGVIQTAPANTLRWTYDPSDLSKAPYLLLEPAATNLVTGSETLSNANWWGGNPSATASAKTYRGAPYVRLAKTTSAPNENRNNSFAGVSAGDTLVMRMALRADTSSVCSVGLYDSASSAWGPAANATARIVEGPGVIAQVNGGLQIVSELSLTADTLIEIVRAYTTTPTAGVLIYPGGHASTVIGDAVLATRVQAELNRPTSYIVTGFNQVTRAADVIAPGAGLVGSSVPINESPYGVAASFAQGAIVYDPATFLTYQSLIAGNAGNALTDTTAWGPLKRVVNRWLMFDKVVNSQTSAANEVNVVIQPGELVNTLGLLNVEGSSVTVTQTDSGYRQTKSLVSHDPLSWYDFFYNEPIRAGDVIFDGIPPYAGSSLSISVINPGTQAAIGCCIMGQAKTLGETDWGFTGGILSYSSVNTDAFGNVTMFKRDNSKVLNFDVYIRKGFESAAYRMLAKEYTDVEIMIIGAEDYSMTYAYGFLGQWNVPVSAAGEKTAHIEFKGLV